MTVVITTFHILSVKAERMTLDMPSPQTYHAE